MWRTGCTTFPFNKLGGALEHSSLYRNVFEKTKISHVLCIVHMWHSCKMEHDIKWWWAGSFIDIVRTEERSFGSLYGQSVNTPFPTNRLLFLQSWSHRRHTVITVQGMEVFRLIIGLYRETVVCSILSTAQTERILFSIYLETPVFPFKCWWVWSQMNSTVRCSLAFV